MFDRHLSRQLAAYIDGELAPQRSRQAEMHLAQCARCRAEFEQVQLGMAMVQRLQLVEAPDSLWTSIETALDGAEPRRTFPTWRWASAFAAIMIAAGLYLQFARQPKTRWDVVRLSGPAAVAGRVGVGEWIETDGASRVRIKVGQIGAVDVEPNTRVRVVAARRDEHRLALRSGEITAKISAPPRLFFVDTPSGTAVDLGCEYRLHSDDAGFGFLQVTAGWVSFEWKARESLVPAGATCRTRPRVGPGTPYFDDASDQLVRALEAFDFENAGPGALSVILAESRVRDTLTLWHLLSRVDERERPRVYDRMAELAPPPAGVSREKVLKLDPKELNRWREELAWTW